jgi:hypothetical protein
VAEPNAKKGFLLRLPQPLFDELRRLAGQDMRSINGQIEWILRDAVKKRGRAVAEDPLHEEPQGDQPPTS